MHRLLRFIGRQPIAPMVRAKIYDQLRELKPFVILENKIDTTPPTDFEAICTQLRESLKLTLMRERELRTATIQSFPGDTNILSNLTKAVHARQELGDEIAFLCRANKLGFSHDNLKLAVSAAEKSLSISQKCLNEHHEALIIKLESTANGALSCPFV